MDGIFVDTVQFNPAALRVGQAVQVSNKDWRGPTIRNCLVQRFHPEVLYLAYVDPADEAVREIHVTIQDVRSESIRVVALTPQRPGMELMLDGAQ